MSIAVGGEGAKADRRSDAVGAEGVTGGLFLAKASVQTESPRWTVEDEPLRATEKLVAVGGGEEGVEDETEDEVDDEAGSERTRVNGNPPPEVRASAGRPPLLLLLATAPARNEEAPSSQPGVGGGESLTIGPPDEPSNNQRRMPRLSS